ncbi:MULTISPECIES: hypothetical protein [Acidiphilium]|uniref:hypothetical protein n=1 Tax=Acidiphilium TaxID=522 RepID=UPI001115608F|nr:MULTISPECIES: hypothetical protein [Acidiphilium]
MRHRSIGRSGNCATSAPWPSTAAEHAASTRLFDRRTAIGLASTPSGRSFVREALALLARADAFDRAVKQKSSGMPAHISIGCFEPFGAMFMPSVIRRYLDIMGPAEASLREGEHAPLANWLATGAVDFALASDIGADLGQSSTPICRLLAAQAPEPGPTCTLRHQDKRSRSEHWVLCDPTTRQLMVHTSKIKRSNNFVARFEPRCRLCSPKPGQSAERVVLVDDNGPIRTSAISRRIISPTKPAPAPSTKPSITPSRHSTQRAYRVSSPTNESLSSPNRHHPSHTKTVGQSRAMR